MDSLKSNEQKNKEDSESIKVILIGNSGTGKTSLIAISAGNVFDSGMTSTTSFSFIRTKIIINKKEYNLDIWDTIGQEKFRSMTQLFVKESYQNTGLKLGRNLVLYVLDHKKEVEQLVGKKITASIIMPTSDKSFELYKKIGFEPFTEEFSMMYKSL